MIRLIIADRNQRYLEALAEYLQAEHRQAFEVTCFTQTNALQECLLNCGVVDILLIDQKLHNEKLNIDNVKKLIILTESEMDYNATTLYKYQKADNIAGILLEESDKLTSSSTLMPRCNNESKLICVYSPGGATGKSTIAYNLAHQYSMQSRKVLLLSFEAFSSLSIFRRSEPARGLIYLLYLIKNKLPNLQLKLNTIKAVDTNTSIHFIERESNILEYKDIKIEDMELLTDFLKKQSGYDVIISDMGCTMNEIALGAFKYCDVILNILCSNNASCAKQEEFIRQIPKISDSLKVDIFSKLINIVNKHEAVVEPKHVEPSSCLGQLHIPFINNPDICNGVYFHEMIYFKQLSDLLENYFSLKVRINDNVK